MSWRRKAGVGVIDEERGIYENVPKDNGACGVGGRGDKNQDALCNALVSGGVDRNVRARSEKRELVDSWFSKSFQNAISSSSGESGRNVHSINYPAHNNGSGQTSARLVCNAGHQNGSFSEDETSRKSFRDRKCSFENENGKLESGKSRKAVAYRGSKTTSLDTSSSNDWDFLTTLNDILRQENFIGDNYNKEERNNVDGGITPQQVPLSPRPPRPLRRSDRRKEYNKTKSMDVVQFQQASNLLQLGEQEKRPMTPTSRNNAARSPSPYQNIQPPPQRPSTPKKNSNSNNTPPVFNQNMNYGNSYFPSPYPNYQPPQPQPTHNHPNKIAQIPQTSQNYSNYGNLENFQQPQNFSYYEPRFPPTSYHPNPPLPPKPATSQNNLNSTMSTSLDSIYDKLKTNEYCGNGAVMLGPINYPPRPLTQIYPPGGYNNTPLCYYGGSGGYPYFEHSSSLPRVWPCPDFRSRSFGSLKGSLLGLDYEDRLLRLESDKETLHLQVSCLSDQIEAQTDKIKDLEKLLDDKRGMLETTEEQLQRELLTRSGLETSKLELLTELSGLRLKQASLERENYELKERFEGKSLSNLNYIDGPSSRVWDKPPVPIVNGTLSFRSASPSQSLLPEGQRIRLGSSGSEPMSHQQRTPPANAYRRVDQSAFGTVPRRSPHSSQLSTTLQLSPEHFPKSSSTGGKSNSLSSGNINAITHYNNAANKQEWERNKSSGNISANGKSLPLSIAPPLSSKDKQTSPGGGHKSRGIMRILGKLRRSNSGGLDSDQISPLGPAAPFTRGGVRATAQPRLGWAAKEPSLPKMPLGHITSWDSDAVVQWLNFIGLSMYAGDVKRWVKTGQQLLDASPHELEKELGIKSHLHKKKVVLALQAFKTSEIEDNAGRLDHNWVIRWLDDVGLPQYKETFSEARVDGRMLNYLTADDLVSLKVTSTMHHASIKRGIQILRIHKFHPDCLCRRGGPTPGLRVGSGGGGELGRVGNNNGSNGSGDYGSSDGGSSGIVGGSLQVASWTNHRVMEWLKAIDLAEYAPNLRGSGVHGALIIFEIRFNAELMATLLSIPANKTLLRRHLNLQINELVGKQIFQEKRTAELSQDFVPINPTTKVKIVKKTQFSLRRKRLSTDYANEELLCPLDLCVFPYRSDSVGQLSSLDNSLEGNSPTQQTQISEKDKVSNI